MTFTSALAPSSATDDYLRAGRIIDGEETARDMVTRVVNALAEADSTFGSDDSDVFADRLGAALDTERVVFSTPIMTNAGRYQDRPLSACAVPPVDLCGDLARVRATVDSYHRAGMGTGFNLDEVADPVSVLRYLNTAAVAGARSGTEDRPVGNMAILSLSHPAAAEFIACKLGADTTGEEWKFNISLRVTDADMRAAMSGLGREHELLRAASGAAYECADPGVLFTDRMNDTNATPHLGEYVSTAPCAEVGLVAGETCQFGYVNLGRFGAVGGDVPVDLEALGDTVRVLVRALDNAIEASLARYPDPICANVMGIKRKIGVGVCGLADLLLTAGLPYDSAEGRQLTRDVLAFLNYTSKLASVDLARRRGPCAAVSTGLSRYSDPAFLNRFAHPGTRGVTAAQWRGLAEYIANSGMLRNCSTVALPPTGRSAPVVGASTGIEPLFRLTDTHHPDGVHPVVRATLVAAGRADLLHEVIRHGRLPDHADVPPRLVPLLATATQITPSGHLAMAAAAQACIDDAVSKTVNLPATCTAAQVYETYVAAWEAGCKGITVYVDGSRVVQPKAL